MGSDTRSAYRTRIVAGLVLLAMALALAGFAVTRLMTGGGAAEAPTPMAVMVPMRDGVRLHTLVYAPADSGRFPVVFTRGYNPGRAADARRFVDAGYVYVGQSTRGHAASEGAMNRFFDDRDDGYDALTWIAAQPWSDGRVAMYGKSYYGITQWLVAPEGHPNLKAMVPQNSTPDLWRCGYRCNGVLTLAMTASGRAYDAQETERIRNYGWDRYYRHLPILTLDTVLGGAENPLWRAYVTHTTYDDYWAAISLRDRIRDIDVPVYLMAGWYDYYPGEAFASFTALREAGVDARLVVNPSDHVNRVVGDRDFGDAAGKDEVGLAIRWLDAVLKEDDNGLLDAPPIRYFTMGANAWREADRWPLPATQFTRYYLHGGGGLQTDPPPADVAPSVYIYDPADPVPTLGGNHSFLGTDHPDLIRVGAVDQRPNERRPDVLVFSTPALDADTEVTGPVTLTLYASTTALDTDFTAKLIDVYPDGTAYNLTEGIVRARFRESIWEAPRPVAPGAVYAFTLSLLPTSNVFKAGHRIRIHVTSSNFPLWNRNLNTGNDPATDTTLVRATQRIYHDARYPSHVTLPIVPAGP